MKDLSKVISLLRVSPWEDPGTLALSLNLWLRFVVNRCLTHSSPSSGVIGGWGGKLLLQYPGVCCFMSAQAERSWYLDPKESLNQAEEEQHISCRGLTCEISGKKRSFLVLPLPWTRSREENSDVIENNYERSINVMERNTLTWVQGRFNRQSDECNIIAKLAGLTILRMNDYVFSNYVLGCWSALTLFTVRISAQCVFSQPHEVPENAGVWRRDHNVANTECPTRTKEIIQFLPFHNHSWKMFHQLGGVKEDPTNKIRR